MHTIAHIINPVIVDQESDLFVAQPITFETIKATLEFARDQVEVTLYSTQYPEDHPLVPADFQTTPDLDRSILDFGTENILVGGFSKSFLMTGWRIGYAVVEEELAKRMIKLNQITTTCVPAFIQYGALKGLESRKKIADDIRTQFKVRADAAYSVLSKSKMRFSRSDAPFYLFPMVDGLDSERFALDLLDKGVAVAPGLGFGEYGDEFVRFALIENNMRINQAVRGIKKIL